MMRKYNIQKHAGGGIVATVDTQNTDLLTDSASSTNSAGSLCLVAS